MIPLAWEMTESDVEEYKTTHKKMDFAGISAYYCFRAECRDLNKRKWIYNHGLSTNTQSKTTKWKEGQVKRTKDPKKNPTSDPEKEKESFKTMEAANVKLRELLRELETENATESDMEEEDIDIKQCCSELEEYMYQNMQL